jgi:hypothetical protein
MGRARVLAIFILAYSGKLGIRDCCFECCRREAGHRNCFGLGRDWNDRDNFACSFRKASRVNRRPESFEPLKRPSICWHTAGRDNAYTWGVDCDAEAANRYLETFLVHSWAEHLRQNERRTRAVLELGATPIELRHEISSSASLD